MLFELVEEYADSVVVKVDDAIVQGGEDPGTVLVEAKALDPLGFGFEFDEHF